MDWTTAATLLVTVILAMAGYVYGVHLARRQARLERVNRQLSQFYGPLMALETATRSSWDEFRRTCRPNVGFWSDPQPTDLETAEWRRWMKYVFMPMNRQMRDLAVQNADLIDEPDYPQCLLDLCAHVSAYEAVLARWEEGDYSENRTSLPFPRSTLGTYATTGFNNLKLRQNRLLGVLDRVRAGQRR